MKKPSVTNVAYALLIFGLLIGLVAIESKNFPAAFVGLALALAACVIPRLRHPKKPS